MASDSLQSAPHAVPQAGARSHAWGWLGVGAGLLLMMVGLLYFFPPGSVWFYPQCIFHKITGLNCPGCGGLRATHQLLHGHLKAAFALNPLVFILAPGLVWFGLAQLWRAGTGRELAHPFKHRAWIWGLLIAVVTFGIVRNLPIPLFHLRPL
jgi:hypothetical protein